jgi:hypothetical protein
MRKQILQLTASASACALLAVRAIALHFASTLDHTTTVCFLIFQMTRLPPKNVIYAVVDCISKIFNPEIFVRSITITQRHIRIYTHIDLGYNQRLSR